MKLKPNVERVGTAKDNRQGRVVEVTGLILGVAGLVVLFVVKLGGAILLSAGLVVFLGGLAIARRRLGLKCPQCAETSKLEAKICKSCGFSFYEESERTQNAEEMPSRRAERGAAMAPLGLRRKHQVGGMIKFLELGSWFDSLTQEQQQKLGLYSGRGENLTTGHILDSSQTPKGFLWCAASSASIAEDYEFAVCLAEKGLESKGTLVDQHFVYNALIEAHWRLGHIEAAKRYCLTELSEFPEMDSALRTEFDGELPGSIPCRDTLMDIVSSEGDEEEVRRLLDILVQKGLLSTEEAEDEIDQLEMDRLRATALNLLEKGNLEEAKATFDEVIRKDSTQKAEVYKTLGKHCMKCNMEDEAFDYLQKALEEDPMIKGVRRELKKLADHLGIELPSDEARVLKALRDREDRATEWWGKRDLALEYMRLKQYDHAWSLLNEAVILRTKQGMPCDTIYPHMAKMREREGRPRDALLLYLLAYRELQGSGGADPPQFVSEGIDKCLKKLGAVNTSHTDLFKSVKKNSQAEEIKAVLKNLLSE